MTGEPMTYEQFKERMDYYRDLLDQQNMSLENIELVNTSIKCLLNYWQRPLIVFGGDVQP